TIELTITEPKYDSILHVFHDQNLDTFLIATLKMDGVTYDSIGIQYKGNITYMLQTWFSNPKYSFNIDMDWVKPNQTLLGYKKVKLNNNCTDPTFVREVVSAKIHQFYLPTYRCNYVKVYLNGNYMGLYTNQEAVNKQFLDRTYKTNDGPFFKGNPNSSQAKCNPLFDWNSDPNLVWYVADSCWYYDNYEIKSDYGWKPLVRMIDTLNNYPSKIKDVLNVDRALWYFAVSNVLPNLDTYNNKYIHNYFIYQQRDKLFHMIPWDLNETFGSLYDTLGNVYNWDPLKSFLPKLADRPLVFQLLNDSSYFKQYFAHIRTIINEVYDSTYLHPIIDSLQNFIYNAVETDPYHEFTMNEFLNNVHNPIVSNKYWPAVNYCGLLDMVNRRKEFLLAYPEIAKVPPVITNTKRNIAQPVNTDMVWVTTTVTNANVVDLMFTTNKYGSFFQPIKMYDDGLHHDSLASDGIYGVMIPCNDVGAKVQYYIKAQNNNAMKFDPQRAEYVTYSYIIGINYSVKLIDSETKDLLLFPNPTTRDVTIKYKDDSEINSEIAVFDMLGNKILSLMPENEKEIHIQLQGLSSGVYNVKIGNSFITKVVLIK
ncbi:MAG: CotH kinase family protein, partial [Bacteroidales bacterium]|nr:CotH kinase family protein [Bacteroidales bacterium]